MVNIVYLESYTSHKDYLKTSTLNLPVESLLTYCIYKYCAPKDLFLIFVFTGNGAKKELTLHWKDDMKFINGENVPWQVAACKFPAVLYVDTLITGLCAVARHICKYRTSVRSFQEHEEGLLGFRKSCLQAPNEVSIWTKFCEVDIIKTVQSILNVDTLEEVPKNLIRFENHLKKPVRVHNVYKIARDLKKENFKNEFSKSLNQTYTEKKPINENKEKSRPIKPRKWKSNTRKQIQIDSSTKIEDLEVSHRFAEGPFLTLADLLLLPSYHIVMQSLGEPIFLSHLSYTNMWFYNLQQVTQIQNLKPLLEGIGNRALKIEKLNLPVMEDVSLYKCDPKRHNPKKRLYTKEEDIENALSTLKDGMELNMTSNKFDFKINWNEIPNGANPSAGHLPDERMHRKSQQLENLALTVQNIAKEGDLIVDFCSGSGHLGILLAHLLPKCTIILLENKEQSLLRARTRVHDMDMKNVLFFQCNLDFFIGKFDIGIALHACGIASDLVLDKCLNANAKFILCPCCYGSLHATDRLVYPRSRVFSGVSIDQYLCIGHAADQTHEEHPLTVRGAKCMAVIDSDRARLAEEYGYKVTLSRLKPLTCTPKNNLLIGIPT
ncbi:glutathione S-transferase C-terminal domain-containing protein homolog [Hyposmocoma kahamanoa]|uniref:glutathione S-transferase C-terminal domain-containing protein homolog n=1 Tax=Hyposmocoma kahamanoa TaxID=1477025 RepID=UPI000E6D9ACC|nr:glutathione S-transferase C-terminal domain-containing protein homolog [Hyposmocoma kahamanoa]